MKTYNHLDPGICLSNNCVMCAGDVERVGRGIEGVLGLALGGVDVCASQAPLGPHLLFKMKAFSRS